MTPNPVLVADIGGTYLRFALADCDHPASRFRLHELRVTASSEHASLEAALQDYLQHLDTPKPKRACFAAAGIVSGDEVHLTNLDWSLSVARTRTRFGFAQLEVVNDFAAVAYSLPMLDGKDLTTVKPGRADPWATRAIIGAGTGLGAAALVRIADGWHTLPTEAGHAAFAPRDDTEMEILHLLMREHAHVSAEALLCGRGLVTLYRALARLRCHAARLAEPADIVAAALHGGDRLATEAVERFALILAGAAADFALAVGARGGVFLGGGIAPRIQPFLEAPSFANRFVHRGAMQSYLAGTPIHLVLHEQPALLGAAAWLSRMSAPRLQCPAAGAC